METGIIVFFVLAITGGIIAYIGDKLGTKIGKKRLTLFGLRPKHTSILVTIITGILIASFSIGVMAVLSENVRVALFGMEKIRRQTEALNQELVAKNEKIKDSEQLIGQKEKEIQTINEKVKVRTQELAEAEAIKEDMSRKLSIVEVAYAKATKNLNASKEEIQGLEKTKQELSTNVARLEDMTKRLEKGLTTVREGKVLFRVGEVLSGFVVDENKTPGECEQVLKQAIYDTNDVIRRGLGITDTDAVILYVSKAEFEQAVEKLKESPTKKLVRITAAGNIVYGEAALVNLEIYDRSQIYKKGDVVYSQRLAGSSDDGSLEYELIQFLKQVNQTVQQKGVLPDPISGTVGSLSGEDLFEAIQMLSKRGGSGKVEAVAAQDIYTEGPLRIVLRVNGETV